VPESAHAAVALASEAEADGTAIPYPPSCMSGTVALRPRMIGSGNAPPDGSIPPNPTSRAFALIPWAGVTVSVAPGGALPAGLSITPSSNRPTTLEGMSALTGCIWMRSTLSVEAAGTFSVYTVPSPAVTLHEPPALVTVTSIGDPDSVGFAISGAAGARTDTRAIGVQDNELGTARRHPSSH